MTSRTAAIYCRISSRSQVGNNSLDEQERLCREYAERNSLEVVLVERDTGSGKEMDSRVGLSKVRMAFREGAVSHLIVYVADRISRDTVDTALLKFYQPRP